MKNAMTMYRQLDYAPYIWMFETSKTPKIISVFRNTNSVFFESIFFNNWIFYYFM